MTWLTKLFGEKAIGLLIIFSLILSTPKDVEWWVNSHVPPQIKCVPRAALASAQLREHGYKTWLVTAQKGDSAHAWVRWEKDGKTGEILRNGYEGEIVG